MGKLGTALLCLVFAIPFGGVGVFASWAIGSTLAEAHRAREWVKVKASVGDAALEDSGGTFRAQGSYRYTFEGKDYAGSRLGISKVGGSDNIDDWHQEVSARLQDARAAGKSVSVWVNPDNPAEAVFDRDIRWSELLFLTPFALAFGGVGVGALVAFVMILLPSKKEAPAGEARQRGRLPNERRTAAGAEVSDGASSQAGPGFLWIFAFFWNALSFPIAILVIPDVIANGEWAGLLVLLFPLVGVGLLWAAISTSLDAFRQWRARRRGEAPVQRQPARTAAGSLANQAARAMFDPQRAGGRRMASSREFVPIPSSLAEVTEQGGTLTIHYARGRNLGLGLMLFVIGGILAAIGAAMFAGEGLGIAVVLLVAIGTLMDVWALSLFVSRLEVAANASELAVEKGGLFGRRSWKIPRQQVESLRPRLSHSINDVPYFALYAHLRAGEPVLVGNGLKGEDLADAVSRRIGDALQLDPPSIRNADPDPTNFKPSTET